MIFSHKFNKIKGIKIKHTLRQLNMFVMVLCTFNHTCPKLLKPYCEL